jgi:uncharacterized protein (TIGR01777 family)
MAFSGRSASSLTSVRIAITGASGFLGSALAVRLRFRGAIVQRVRRDEKAAAPDIAWRPDGKDGSLSALNGAAAVVHLAGEPIAQRWTDATKRAISESRIGPTAGLAQALARLDTPPGVLLSGSAIGIYGNRDSEELDEESAPGSDFLAQTAVGWERATLPASAAGIRVVHLRTGLVLSPTGGALTKMLTPFKLGLGGRFGSGKQWMSWISLSDWLAAVEFLLDASLAGPVNLVAPNPVTNDEFSRTLARVLSRPALAHVPARAIELLFGEMGRATLLTSQRVHPRRLMEASFEFGCPTLEQALRAELADKSES